MKIFPEKGEGAIYFKWWFWMGVVILVCATLYAVRYTQWNAEYMSKHAEDYARGAAFQVLQYKDKQLEEQYKADTFGGDTPEATLKLFVEALEKKDFELAAKYYVPEKQSSALKLLSTTKFDDMSAFIDAYKIGTIESSGSKITGEYGMNIYAKNDSVPYSIKFIKNPFTAKWKITDPS